MSEQLKTAVTEICQSCDNDRSRMMDVVEAVQKSFGCVSGEAMELIAEQLGVHRVEVEGVVSFYAFSPQQVSLEDLFLQVVESDDDKAPGEQP